jgi:hypothetical protein
MIKIGHVLVLGVALAASPSFIPVADAAQGKTAMPTSGEWNRATHLRDVPGGCVGTRVREWYRLKCDDAMYGSAVLLAGARDGVFLKVDGDFHATVLMAVRRGDSRVIQLNRAVFGDGYEGEGGEQVPGWTVSESWGAEEAEAGIVVE